jgi:putative transposase
MGTVGDAYDNAVIESFWGRTQTELLNRQKWKTRVELENAIFEYLEIFHNRTRRLSSLGMLTPIEYEKLHTEATNVARFSRNESRKRICQILCGRVVMVISDLL